MIDANLTGAYRVAQRAAKGMLRQRKGRLIFISSVVALVGSPGQVELRGEQGRPDRHGPLDRARARFAVDHRQRHRAGLHRDRHDRVAGRGAREGDPRVASRSVGTAAPTRSPAPRCTSRRRPRPTCRESCCPSTADSEWGSEEHMGLLDGKRLLITGVITEASIAFAVARLAQQEGAQVVLTGFGRMSLVERVAAKLPQPAPVVELDVVEPGAPRRAGRPGARARRRRRRRAALDRLRAGVLPRRRLPRHPVGRRRHRDPGVGVLAQIARRCDPSAVRRRAAGRWSG